MKKIVLAASLLAFFPVSAEAASKYISSPSVQEGWAVKNRGAVQWGNDGDDAWINKTDLEYGINNHFKVGIAGEITKFENDSLDYVGTDLKATYRFTGDESSLQGAIQGAYKFDHDGNADEIEAKLLLAGAAYGLDHKTNLALSHEVGDDADGGIGASFAWGSYYALGNGVDVGGEYYADFGNLSDGNGWSDQEHHIGPVVGFNVPVGQRTMGARLGYLIGLSDAAADNVVKYEMNMGF